MTICTLCVEIDATYSDPPIRIKLLGLRSSQGHPQFKNGTVYRQVRPTNIYREPPDGMGRSAPQWDQESYDRRVASHKAKSHMATTWQRQVYHP